MDETTQEILQDNNNPISDSGDNWDSILNDLHDSISENNQLIYEVLDKQDNVPDEYYQNINNYMSMSIVINSILIGLVLALIFSNFFAGGNHK